MNESFRKQSEYELRREATILRNSRVLERLGLASTAPPNQRVSRGNRQVARRASTQPTRRSSRLRSGREGKPKRTAKAVRCASRRRALSRSSTTHPPTQTLTLSPLHPCTHKQTRLMETRSMPRRPRWQQGGKGSAPKGRALRRKPERARATRADQHRPPHHPQ